MGILSGATVNTLYFILISLGLLYALVLLFSGQLGTDAGLDMDGVDAGLDLDVVADGEPGLSPISPLTIATFVTAFGATGLVSRTLFGAAESWSVLWASLGGVLFSVITYLGFTYLLIKPQGSSEVRTAELAGLRAEVITPIPAAGLGEIALVAQGGRVIYPARSARKKKIARGITVHVSRVVGGVAYVDPEK